MYILTIMTPSNDESGKMVRTYYVQNFTDNFGVRLTEWDEDIKYAKVFASKLEAKQVQSYLRTLQGSEKCKIALAKKFSKN
jgi:hypothetical protein